MLLEEKNMIKNIKKSVKESFIAPLLIIIFAVILQKNPENFISVAIQIFGYGAVFIGVLDIVFWFHSKKEQRVFKSRLMIGTMLISFGIIAFFEVETLGSMITILLGAYLILQNANRLELAATLKEYTKKLWIYLIIMSLLNLILSLLLIINPFKQMWNMNDYMSILLIGVETILFIENIAILFGVKEHENVE